MWPEYKATKTQATALDVEKILWLGVHSDTPAVAAAVQDLMQELDEVADRWYYIGIQMGLPLHRLSRIQGSEKECLRVMLKTLLETAEEPEAITWQLVVDAVECDAGGRNPALAQQIATNHSSGH